MPQTIDPAWLESLAAEYYQPLFRFACSLTKNETDAADLTQQTFYIAQLKLQQMRDVTKVKTWLFTTLSREFLQKKRHETRFPKYNIELVQAELPEISADQATGLDSAAVIRALQSLEGSFRLPLALFYLEQMSYKGIADLLKVPIGTVMSRLARGKIRLRQILTGADTHGRAKRNGWPPTVADNAAEAFGIADVELAAAA